MFHLPDKAIHLIKMSFSKLSGYQKAEGDLNRKLIILLIPDSMIPRSLCFKIKVSDKELFRFWTKYLFCRSKNPT